MSTSSQIEPVISLPQVPAFIPEARPFPFPLPLPDLPAGGPGRGIPGFPRLLPRIPGWLPDLNPNPRPGDSGDYWSVPNQVPGGDAADKWPDQWDRQFPSGVNMVIRVVSTQNAYTLVRASDGATRSEPKSEQITDIGYANVVRVQSRNLSFRVRFVVGQGDRFEQKGLWGLRIVTRVRGQDVVVRRFVESRVLEINYGEWSGSITGGTTFAPLSFDGEPAVAPRKVPDYWPGHGFPDRAPPLGPDPEGFVPSDPYAPTSPPERKAPPIPLTPPSPSPGPPLPVPAPPKVPAPIPPSVPQERPGTSPRIQPKPSRSPGTAPGPGPFSPAALPEIGPLGLPTPAAQPIPQTAPWQEMFLGQPIGQPSARDRATLPEIARQAGKLEQKGQVLGDLQQSGGLDPDLVAALAELRAWLNAYSPGGVYTLAGPCERGPDGSLLPPVEVEYPATTGPVDAIAARIDAIAYLLQVHKIMGQPACVKERKGAPVTVILREKL